MMPIRSRSVLIDVGVAHAIKWTVPTIMCVRGPAHTSFEGTNCDAQRDSTAAGGRGACHLVSADDLSPGDSADQMMNRLSTPPAELGSAQVVCKLAPALPMTRESYLRPGAQTRDWLCICVQSVMNAY
jgi:hypothetical protein